MKPPSWLRRRPEMPVFAHPDECTMEVEDGRWRCVRPEHPTLHSDCAPPSEDDE